MTCWDEKNLELYQLEKQKNKQQQQQQQYGDSYITKNKQHQLISVS